MSKKIATAIIVFSIFTFYKNAIAQSADSGTISQLFVAQDGSMAIKLSGGFPNAQAAGECPTSNGFAGFATTVNVSFKNAIISAKSFNKTVTAITAGCQGEQWYKLIQLYTQ